MSLEIKLPEDISYGFIGGPQFSTETIIANNGWEQRRVNWSHSLSKYTIAYDAISVEQMAVLRSFFYICKGRAYSFRFKDWLDCSASKQKIGIWDNVQKEFQLVKIYSIGEYYYIRKINKPVNGSIKIYSEESIIDSSEYNVDYKTGIIEFLSASHETSTKIAEGTVIYADFEFDVPVRFDSDFFSGSIIDYATYSCKNINLVEVKIAPTRLAVKNM